MEIKHYVTQHIEWYQLSKDLILSYEVQSENISKCGSNVNFKISHIFESSTLILLSNKFLEGSGIKTVFSCLKSNNVLWGMPIFHTDSQTLRFFFSKSTFRRSVIKSPLQRTYHISKMQCPFNLKKFAPKE